MDKAWRPHLGNFAAAAPRAPSKFSPSPCFLSTWKPTAAFFSRTASASFAVRRRQRATTCRISDALWIFVSWPQVGECAAGPDGNRFNGDRAATVNFLTYRRRVKPLAQREAFLFPLQAPRFLAPAASSCNAAVISSALQTKSYDPSSALLPDPRTPGTIHAAS